MVKLGMPTMVQMESIREGAALCRELGLDFLELNINFPQFTLEAMDVEELKAIREEYGIDYSLHLDDEMSIADFNPYVADGYCRTVYDAVALSKQLGIRKLNMHMSRGAKYTLPDRVIYFFQAYEDAYLQRIRDFRDTCTEAIDILLESPVFGLTIDIGHNYCAKNMDEDWILAHGDRLSHMHVHDACDGTKDHRTLGTGELDVMRYLSIAEEHDCTVVLETKTFDALRESMEWLKRQ